MEGTEILKRLLSFNMVFNVYKKKKKRVLAFWLHF